MNMKDSDALVLELWSGALVLCFGWDGMHGTGWGVSVERGQGRKSAH